MDSAAEAFMNRKLGPHELRHVRDAGKRFVTLLTPGEQLIHAAACTVAGVLGLLAITDRRIVFVARDRHATTPMEYPLATITGITTERGTQSGRLSLLIDYWPNRQDVDIMDVSPIERYDEIVAWLREDLRTS